MGKKEYIMFIILLLVCGAAFIGVFCTLQFRKEPVCKQCNYHILTTDKYCKNCGTEITDSTVYYISRHDIFKQLVDEQNKLYKNE